jgi:hypothetical protein
MLAAQAVPGQFLPPPFAKHWGGIWGDPGGEGWVNPSKDEEIYIPAQDLSTPLQVACYLWHVLKIKEIVWLPKRNAVTNRIWRNGFRANTEDYQPCRFPSKRTGCGFLFSKTRQHLQAYSNRNQAIALSSAGSEALAASSRRYHSRSIRWAEAKQRSAS